MSNAEIPPAAWDQYGWVSLPGPNGKGGVHAWVHGDQEGRKVITDLYVHGDEITSAVVRAIPLGRIEAMANSSATLAWFWEKAAADGTLRRDVALSELRERAPKGGTVQARPHEPLTRPDGTDPDGFSRRVAEAYKAAVVGTSRPAKVLADEAGVPVTTVHRWIREARQRGYLPPARKGRAG